MPAASQPVSSRAGLRACELKRALVGVPLRPRRLPAPGCSGCCSGWLAYRCGGSAGLVIRDLGSEELTGFPFQPIGARRRVTLKRAQCTRSRNPGPRRAGLARLLLARSRRAPGKFGTRRIPQQSAIICNEDQPGKLGSTRRDVTYWPRIARRAGGKVRLCGSRRAPG